MTKSSSSSSSLCGFQKNTFNTTLILLIFLILLITPIHSRNPMFDLDLASQTLNPQVTGFMMTGKSAQSDYFGYAVSTAGDINKDGYADFIVGAYMKDTVYVVYGNDKTSLSNWNFNAGDTLDPLTTGFVVKGNAVGDSFGNAVNTAGDVNKDGYDDIIIGAYKKASYRGEAYVIYGGEKSTMTHLDLSLTPLNPLTTGFKITGQSTGDYLGCAVSTAGDIDGDQYDDIIIGAYNKGSGLGYTYVIYGAEKSSLPNIALSTALNPLTTGFSIQGGVVGDELGVSVSTAGDINKDGYADMIVGAPSKAGLMGAVYVIYGGPKSTMMNLAPSSTPLSKGFWITGNAASDRLGLSVSSAGDINKDGYGDIILGAPWKNGKQGAAYVIYGGEKATMNYIPLASTPLDPSTTGFMLTGNAANNYFGWSVSRAGDINKDGYADIIVGAYGRNSNKGAAYVIYGGEKSSLPNRDFSLGATLDPLTSGFMITGDAVGDYLGYSVRAAGDVNKDGYGDIIVGAYGSYKAYVIYASCSANCKQCSSEAVCTECKASFLLYQDQCFATCPAKSYPTAPTCSACPTPCKLCTSSSVCTQCEASYVLYNSQCVNSCPAGRYLSPTTCELCISPCSKCNSATICTECISSYGLYLSQCVNSCPVGMYLSPTTCETCPTPCSKCTSASVCTECKASYVLYNSQCVNSCPPGRFLSPTTCESCVSPCSECTSVSECTACVAPYSLFGSQCVTSCPITTYSFNSICNNCSSYCYSCTSKESCQVCFPEFTLQNSLCIFSSSSEDLSYLEAQQKATQIISSATRGIGSVICIGSAAFPLSALVSKIVQNTRYINLSVTSDLAGVYKTWQTNIISWDVPNVMEELDHFETAPVLFSQYDLGSPFLVNFWPTLINVGIGFGSFVAFLLLQKLFEQAQYEGWVYSIVQRLVAGSFNFALIQAYACLDDILFYLVLDAKTNPFNSSFSWASIICAGLFLAIGCLQVFFNFWTVKKYQNIKTQGGSIEAFNERNKYWELFYSDFNDDDLWSQAFFAIAIIRSAIQSFIITVLYDYPLMQTPFLVIMDGAVLFFLYFKNPFRTLRGKLAQYYYEIITLLVHICAFSMALQDTFKTSSYTVTLIMSTGILYLNTALVSGAIGFMFIEIYETIRLRNKELKRKQRPNIPEENQENQNLTAQTTGPFHLSETDIPTKQEETKSSPERFYFFPESYQRNSNNNMTSFDLNTESSSQGLEPNFYGGDSIVTDMNSSNGMNHQINHQSPMPIMIRRRTQAFRPRQKTRDPRIPNYRINHE